MSATNEIVRRPGSEQDRELLYTLLERALGPQIERTYGPWDESWQRQHFLETSDPTAHEIIELAGQPIGCLLLEERPECLELHRIFLFSEQQNRGIGAGLLREVLSIPGLPACAGCGALGVFDALIECTGGVGSEDAQANGAGGFDRAVEPEPVLVDLDELDSRPRRRELPRGSPLRLGGGAGQGDQQEVDAQRTKLGATDRDALPIRAVCRGLGSRDLHQIHGRAVSSGQLERIERNQRSDEGPPRRVVVCRGRQEGERVGQSTNASGRPIDGAEVVAQLSQRPVDVREAVWGDVEDLDAACAPLLDIARVEGDGDEDQGGIVIEHLRGVDLGQLGSLRRRGRAGADCDERVRAFEVNHELGAERRERDDAVCGLGRLPGRRAGEHERHGGAE
ncbi:MAG: GNAT family N-acetyltransferase [Myxococcota bacterium]|nr:GNAT family N-acetyltransferase [Myxococcota bacterium]